MDTSGHTPNSGAHEPDDRSMDEQATEPFGALPGGAGAPDGEGIDAATRPAYDEPGALTTPGGRGDLYPTSDATLPGGVAGWGTPASASESFRAPISTRRGMSPEELRMRSHRRRRYTMYLRRATRARAASRSATLSRAVWATVIIVGVLLLTTISATLATAAAYYESQAGAVLALSRTVASRDSIRIYDSTGVLLYQVSSNGAQHSIPLAHIPVDVINATISAEDRTFWTNYGVDPNSVVRAALANFTHQSITQGASTITQQLIKQNILGSAVSYDRKIKEIVLATGLTVTGVYTKSQIMNLYLNSIDYGHEAYGIDSAAQVYFGYTDNPATGETAAQHLDLAQASMLAGIPQNPNLNDPITHFATAAARQLYVLQGMVTLGFITKAQENAAIKETIQPNGTPQPNFFHLQPTPQKLAPHFVDFVLQQLKAMVDAHQIDITRSGLNVYTTLNLDLQNHVQAAMVKHLYGTDHDDYGNLIVNDHVTNTAGIMVDQHTGAILVMQGSVDYYSTQINGQFNVVTQGFRGTGSSFKPIAYATAFSQGWFPAMTIADVPSIFYDAGSGTEYKPLDFDRLFPGEMTLRHALQTSRNIPAVKVMQFDGVQNVERNAIRMGLQARDGEPAWQGTWGLSSVLGTLDVTPYSMVQMYATLANYGSYVPLYAINSITDSSGNAIFQYHVPQGVQVLSPQVAFMATSVLSDNAARQAEFGACSPLYLDPLISPDDPGYIHAGTGTEGPVGNAECYKILANGYTSSNNWPAAVKTGTNNLTDDWTIGYTMDYTMAVWAGNNDYSNFADPSQVGHGIDGITGAAPTWYRSMIYAERNLPQRQFPVPSGVQRHTWTSNGITSNDWFLSGPIPPNNTGGGGTNFVPCFTPDGNSWNFCAGGTAVITPGPGGAGQGKKHKP